MKNPEQFNITLPESESNKKRPLVPDEQVSLAEIPEQAKNNPIFETDDKVFFMGVDVDKGKGGNLTVKKEKFEGDVVTTFDLKLMRDMAVALKLNQPVILEGGSGIGKSRTVDRMGAMLNREVYYANCEKFDTDILIGRPDVKEDTKSGFGWRDGIVLQAIRNGGVLFLDEYNFMPGETRGGLHEVIDAILQKKDSITVARNHGERIPVHPDFRIIAAENPPGDEYGDRQVLDPAQYTRFSHIQVGEKMPTEVKKSRALGRFGIDNKINLSPNDFLFSGKITEEEIAEIPGFEMIVEKYIEFTEALEEMVNKGKLAKDQPQSPAFAFQRDYDRVVGFVLTFFKGDLNETFQKALRYYYLNHFTKDEDKKKIEEMIANVKADITEDSRRKGLEDRKGKKEKEEAERKSKEDEEKSVAESGKTEAEKILEKADEEVSGLKKSLRGKKKETSGETFEPTISAEYKYKDEKGKEKKETIEIDFEEKLEEAESFYKKHDIKMPADFTEQMQDIWTRNKDEMEKAVEEKGFDEVLIVPGGLSLSDLNKKMSEGYDKTWESDNFKEGGSFKGVKEKTSESRIVLLHNKNAEDLNDRPELKETLGKKAESFIKSGETLTLTDYLIYQKKYFEETGKHLDADNYTWLPGSKSGSRVVSAYWRSDDGRLCVGAPDAGHSRSSIGCRLSRSFS